MDKKCFFLPICFMFLLFTFSHGMTRYKPSVVLIPLGSTNSPEAYAKAYSILFGRIRSFGGINLITNGPALQGLLERMPEGAETNSFITIHEKIIGFAYEHFIDEVFLIKNGKTSSEFVDVIGRHVDNGHWSWNYNETVFTEENLNLQIDGLITNMLTGVAAESWSDPNFLNFDGNLSLKDLKSGKMFDLKKCRGKLVVLSQCPASAFKQEEYVRMKAIFGKLHYKFPDIETIFGVHDSAMNGENIKGKDVLRENGVLTDQDFDYPVVDISPLPLKGKQISIFSPLLTFNYGYLTDKGMTNKKFEVYTHERFIFGNLEEILPPEKRAEVRTTLVEAARDDDLPMVKKLIEEGASPLVDEDYVTLSIGPSSMKTTQ